MAESAYTRLTPARRKALRYFSQNDGSALRPTGLARLTLDRLVKEGLLRRQAPPFGFVRHFITDEGRRALGQEG